MAVTAYRDFQVYAVDFVGDTVDTEKWGRKNLEKFKTGHLVLKLKHQAGSKPDIKIRDSVTRCGSGAFKDVFMLDNHDLVFKLFLKKLSEGPDDWIPKAKEEQTRFEMYRNFAENEMAFCFGQVFLDVNNAEGDVSIRTGIRWQGDESKTNGAASATVVEKLIVVGKNQLITCLGLECTAEHWQSFAQMQIEILRLMFRFLHHGIAPWDAKLDNVGLAQPRPPSSSPAWVFCDLDGLRDKREWKNLGSAFKRIIKTMTTSDRDMLRPHEMQARRNGWVGPVEEMQALIYSAFVTHEFGTEHWSWLCLHYGLKKIVRIRKGCKHLSTGRGPCVSVCVFCLHF